MGDWEVLMGRPLESRSQSPPDRVKPAARECSFHPRNESFLNSECSFLNPECCFLLPAFCFLNQGFSFLFPHFYFLNCDCCFLYRCWNFHFHDDILLRREGRFPNTAGY